MPTKEPAPYLRVGAACIACEWCKYNCPAENCITFEAAVATIHHDLCIACDRCVRVCPVDAITSDRFLIHAERCITFHNEKPSSVPFPASMDPAWHNCLVGCLHCQRICPENKDVWPWVEERAEFTADETALLLEGVPPEEHPGSLVEKLERSNLAPYLSLLPRNLLALFDQ